MIEQARTMGKHSAACVAWAALWGVTLGASPLLAQPRPGLEAAPPADLVHAAPAQQNIVPAQGPPLRDTQRPAISLQQAIEIAQSRYPGRVVRADTKMEGDRTIYEIRILGADNRVRTVRIDAQGSELR